MKRIELRYTNCFLLEQGKGYALIDTGYEYEWDRFRAGLDSCGVALADITHVILTHHHDDHCGLLNRLVLEHPGIVVVASALTAKRLSGGVHVFRPGSGYITRRVQALAWVKSKLEPSWDHSFPPYLMRPQDRVVELPSRLSSLGMDLAGTLLSTSGHTEDSLSILMENGDCFAGDAAANFLQFAGCHYCVIFIEDLGQYYESWEALLAAGARTIYPAHGKPFPARKLRENLHRHERISPWTRMGAR